MKANTKANTRSVGAARLNCLAAGMTARRAARAHSLIRSKRTREIKNGPKSAPCENAFISMGERAEKRGRFVFAFDDYGRRKLEKIGENAKMPRMTEKQKITNKTRGFNGAGGGTRTLTYSRTADFESVKI